MLESASRSPCRHVSERAGRRDSKLGPVRHPVLKVLAAKGLPVTWGSTAYVVLTRAIFSKHLTCFYVCILVPWYICMCVCMCAPV